MADAVPADPDSEMGMVESRRRLPPRHCLETTGDNEETGEAKREAPAWQPILPDLGESNDFLSIVH
ncbi:hypothetical protein U8335_17465 [Roseiconus lacunae]|uniref:hypothetical protein n=1 Tax=Roseiconus lacunae TaxID=2605694 RepID=UPI001E2F9D34|nr:hypothetical protein [Roseiconus lacunae]MCD0460903.1 hypothetical protein [Roseiconus lacunae]WRQ48747.1 hypothetical protein U8335_17465 [Stieleria sp. HD01]